MLSFDAQLLRAKAVRKRHLVVQHAVLGQQTVNLDRLMPPLEEGVTEGSTSALEARGKTSGDPQGGVGTSSVGVSSAFEMVGRSGNSGQDVALLQSIDKRYTNTCSLQAPMKKNAHSSSRNTHANEHLYTYDQA